jgi:methionine synthase I (cobalamin-dependent)/5,10-methylenetetrahydrofolate reductase
LSQEFLERLTHGVLVADGAMGSMIARSVAQEKPATLGRTLLEINLANPEVVHNIHLQYIAAGADVIETNSFGASRARLERLGLGDEADAILSAAVKIAREARDASGRAVFIAGSISPLDADWMLETNPTAAAQSREFEAQATTLLERGADLLVLETFSRLSEILLAMKAVRRVSRDVPIVAQMSFDERGMLASGESADIAAHIVTGSGDVQILGVNCSLGPQASLAVLEALSHGTTLPLSIMPNAGFAQRLGGRVLYPDMSAGYYANFAREARELGARLVGGCCGTTPQQIHAIGESLRAPANGGADTTRPRLRVTQRADLVDEDLPGVSQAQPSQFAQRLRAGKFVRSLQIDPQRGPFDDANRRLLETLRDRQLVDLVDINSSGASSRQDSLQVAAGIESLGVETLPHITPRDASVAGVLSQVLGAYDWGAVRNVLVIAGDPPKGDLYAEAKGVYQVDSIGLVRALTALRAGQKVNDRITMPPFPLTVGAALNQNAPDLDEELARLHDKIEAGADFVMTQPFFTLEDWERFRARLKGRDSIPVLLGVWPLTSYRQACRVNENVAGVVVPDSVLRQLERAGASEREVGFQLAAELLAALERDRSAAGAYVVAPFKQPAQALEVFDRLGARAG